MSNIDVNKIEFGGLDQDGNTWLLEIEENEELNEIMGINNNDLKDCVLVCFESSNDLYTGKKFCHRRMVAGWLEEKLGIEVPEETRTGHYVKVPAIYRNTTYSELQA